MSRLTTDMITSDTNSQMEYRLPLHGLAALRIAIVFVIGLGYASTMGIGGDSPEWGRHWGYDPSRYGVQLLFIFSGFLAAQSMTNGRTVREFFGSRVRSLWPALIAATLFSVCIIYPIMCAPDAPVRMSASDLATYTLKTVFLIDPGTRMPGLMDDAKYMCLLQGAIWTLQWGLILHVGFLFGWFTRLLSNRVLSLTLTFAAIALYVTVIDTSVLDSEFAKQVEPIVPGIRLGYAYLIGVTLFHWQGVLRLNLFRILAGSIIITGLTTGFYLNLPWSSLLEVMGVFVWLTLCIGFLYTAPQILRHCPRAAPMLYVSIWPAAQIVVSLTPEISQFDVMKFSLILATSSAGVLFLLLRETRIKPTRF
ncbi:MAG: hypothetical protein ABJO36_04430 [Litorimonas sp.]